MSASDPGSEGAQSDLSALFATEWSGMVRMATLLVGSRAIAEEVVQDAFISTGDRWSSVERPGAYLRTSVVRGCAAVLRRRELEDRHSHGPSHADVVLLPTHLVELRDALNQLNERQRAVIVMRYFVDIHDHEIAETLGVRPSTVRSLARRALATLRKELS